MAIIQNLFPGPPKPCKNYVTKLKLYYNTDHSMNIQLDSSQSRKTKEETCYSITVQDLQCKLSKANYTYLYHKTVTKK